MSDDLNSLQLVETLNSRALSAPLPPLEVQHAWFRAARSRTWTSIALVPVIAGVRVLPIARGMGQMATQEPGSRVLVVNACTAECSSAANGEDVEAAVHTDPEYGYDLMDLGGLPLRKAQQALALLPQLLDRVTNAEDPYSTVLLAMDPVLYHTRSLPAVRAADRTILCVPLGQTTFKEARDVVGLIGRDKVLGCIAIRPFS